MSNMFSDLDSSNVEHQDDRLGGYQVHDSDIYPATVKLMYGVKAQSGAKGVFVSLDLGNGKEYSETIYVTDKAGKNYYEKDGKNNALPGFTQVEHLCLILNEKALKDQVVEEKVANVYDPKQSKQVPTNVPMFVEAIGQRVDVGILRQKVNKQVKGADNKYHDTNEEVERNSIDKFFHPETHQTITEATNGKDAEFYDKWLEKNRGKVQNRFKTNAEAGKSGRPAGSAPQSGEGGQARKSLFGDKK